MLLWTGVKLSKDGKSVFNYNPGHFQAGLNFLIALPLLPGFLNRAHFFQLIVLYCVMQLYLWLLADSTAADYGPLDKQVQWCYGNIAGISRFVLGLFVSLVLSKTYYANRGVFGTVFGCAMGLAQMTVSWVRVPPRHSGNVAAKESSKKAQEMIVRWINAAFRLMWLEAVPGVSTEAIGKEMISENLLTQAEWDKITGLSSRCTHIYQWISNVLSDLTDRGYVGSYAQLSLMQKQVDSMRGANVWGLPSLPITYVQIITHMVKMHVMILAINNGALARHVYMKSEQDGYGYQNVLVLILLHLDLAFHHYLYQGLLDLHGALYNPNAGSYLGHLPALNFMSFVKDVTNHLVSENDTLPYKLSLVDLNHQAVDET